MDTRRSEQSNKKPVEKKLKCEKCGKVDCAVYLDKYNDKWYCFEHSEYSKSFQE